jgi:hypothetical protein
MFALVVCRVVMCCCLRHAKESASGALFSFPRFPSAFSALHRCTSALKLNAAEDAGTFNQAWSIGLCRLTIDQCAPAAKRTACHWLVLLYVGLPGVSLAPAASQPVCPAARTTFTVANAHPKSLSAWRPNTPRLKSHSRRLLATLMSRRTMS